LLTAPHNPCGKVFTKEEFKIMSDILNECPHVIVFHDACYADLTFDGRENLWFASLFDNWERTITCVSAGKLLNCTGWRIGWAIGPAKLIQYGNAISLAMFDTFQTPGQVALARNLESIWTEPYTEEDTGKEPVSFVEHFRKIYQANRDYMVEAFKSLPIPIRTLYCPGGYFLIVDVSACADLIPDRYKKSHEYEEDKPELGAPVEKMKLRMLDGSVPLSLAFCRWLAIEHGVVMLPVAKFYGRNTTKLNENYVRVTISKPLSELKQVMEKLKSMKVTK
jgi:aspartate/methionine/tyrosine aminotransferase